MEPTIELRVAELLASRLCHDLISPVGAVNSGIELMTEFGDGLRLVAPVCANQRTRVVIGDQSAGALPGPGAVKLLLNIALVAGECLPRGGELGITIGPDMAVLVSARGEGARIEDNLRAALDGSINGEDLDPKTAHGYFTHLAAKRLGIAFDVEAAPDHVAFAAKLPTSL